MSFWNTFEKANTKPKTEIIKPEDIVEILDKNSTLSTTEHTATRFLGPIFGFSTISVPIIKEGRFFRKKDTNNLISIPKQSLGYSYQTNELDESKCPYLQHVTLGSDELLVATINYVKESTLKDKEILLTSLENEGLRASWYNKQTKAIIDGSRELNMLLMSIAKKGTKEFYTNLVVYSDAHPITEAMRNIYTDMSVRSPSEKTPVNYLDYSSSYGLPVYLKDSKASAATTPVKVFKMSESTFKSLFEDVVKLNTVIIDKEARTKEFKGVEDPEFGCEVLVKLEETAFRTSRGEKTYMTKVAKGERIPLTDAEKKYLLWDLTKLKTNETYDQAVESLKGLGYNVKGSVSKVESFDQPEVKVATPAPIAVTTAPKAEVKSAIPAEAVSSLPWGDQEEVKPEAVEKPVKQMVKATASDDFDNLFDK